MQSVLLTQPSRQTRDVFCLDLVIVKVWDYLWEGESERENWSWGLLSQSISSWVIYICQYSVALGIFLHLLKIKTNLRGAREPGQHRIGVWEQRGHLASLRHPVSPSYHSKSALFFQPGFLSPSSHHAFLLLTLFLPTLARKEEDLTAVCQAAFAAVRRGAGGRRLGTLPGVNPENGGWVRPLQKHRSLREGWPPPAALLAVSMMSFWGDSSWQASLESISEWGLHPWPRMGWWAHLQPLDTLWRTCICNMYELYRAAADEQAAFQSCSEGVLLQLPLGWHHP